MQSVLMGRSALCLAAAIFLYLPSLAYAADGSMAREFGQTCFASRSADQLEKTLSQRKWTKFRSLSESHLERELAAVAPMLTAQGLSSDYVVYGRGIEGHYFELAFSKTRKPLSGSRILIGCSMYDFAAVSPIDVAALGALVPTSHGEETILGDVRVTKWEAPFGGGSGMRAVFVPRSSPLEAQIGFTGMMLGTHFLDPAP